MRSEEEIRRNLLMRKVIDKTFELNTLREREAYALGYKEALKWVLEEE